jgi:hypothetical protein
MPSGGDNCKEVKIALYQGGELIIMISDGTENDGIYDWTIPENVPGVPRDSYVIMLSDPSNGATLGESGGFKIPSSCSIRAGFLLPVAAHAEGPNGALWKTELMLLNPDLWYEMDIFLYFNEDLKENNPPRGYFYHLQPHSMIEIDDVVWNAFGKNGAGSILLNYFSYDPTMPLFMWFVFSRTYYQRTDGGTFGAEIPGIMIPIIGAPAEWLWHLKENERFRTNIGMASMEDYPITLKVSLFKSDLSLLGEKTITLPPYGFHQENGIFREFTQDAVDLAYAVVAPTNGTPRYYCYASVIDNITNDPSYISPY